MLFRLQLLGGVFLRCPGGTVERAGVQRHRLALLTLLGGSRTQVWSRDKLAGYLWPERDETHARHLLSNSVYVLRRCLGKAAIRSIEGSLQLNTAVVQTDAVDFEEALEHDSLEEAATLYSGPFADGFFVSTARELDDWLESRRTHFDCLYQSCLEALATQALSFGDYPRACAWWQKLASHNPYNSRVILELANALAKAGDPADAVQAFRDHARFLSEELGMKCPADLAALARRLQRN